MRYHLYSNTLSLYPYPPPPPLSLGPSYIYIYAVFLQKYIFKKNYLFGDIFEYTLGEL